MPIYKEVAVRSVLVLAHAGFEQRWILQLRQPASHICAHLLQTLFAYSAIARLGIEGIAVSVAGDLDAAILDIRQPVHLVFMVQPNRHRRRPELTRTSRWSEVEHLLAGGKDPGTQELGKDPRQ